MYGWKGRTLESLLDSVMQSLLDSFSKTGYTKVYRTVIALPSDDFSKVFKDWGTGIHWSAYKEGGDEYANTKMASVPGAVLYLIEGKVHFSQIAEPWKIVEHRIRYPRENEIVIQGDVFVENYTTWEIPIGSYEQTTEWSTTGKDYKPW